MADELRAYGPANEESAPAVLSLAGRGERMIDPVPFEPRSISFLGREGRVKHYGIGTHDRVPRPALSEATREAAHGVIPEDAVGFTIAHDATSAGLGLLYWWAN